MVRVVRANRPLQQLATSLAIAAVVSCGGKGKGAPPTSSSSSVVIAPKGKVLEAAENERAGAGVHAAKALAFGTGERADVAAGKLTAGSTPGDKGRDPALEPVEMEVELGGFSIDKYLFPNDPTKAPITGVSRAKAALLCQQASARLCTELEWERACKGPDDQAYAGGAAWDAACAKSPTSCQSGFGVLGMGAALREWTSSDVAAAEGATQRPAVARGARGDAAGVDHRCAHRAALDATTSGDDLGFRCCHGPPNAATIPAPPVYPTYRKADLSPKQARDMFDTVPQLKGISGDISWFKEPDDVREVMNRADAGMSADKVPNTTFTTQPLLWNPVPGEEVLVVAGRAKKTSFIVAFHRLPGDRYRIASSIVMKDEKGPIVLAYNPNVKRKFTWNICYDCRGESGNVSYREDNRVVITQR
jgi:formylglycine-generating enzyme required for sulfatase activity